MVKNLSRKDCLKLLERHSVPVNVVAHVLVVEKIAVFLAEKIKENGFVVDVSLVSRSALLHDIGKLASIRAGEQENIVSKRILEEEGLKKEALVAFRHMISEILDSNSFASFSLEEKIVYYADKRVLHDRIVSVRERAIDLAERYESHRETILLCLAPVLELERKLLSMAKVSEKLEGLK